MFWRWASWPFTFSNIFNTSDATVLQTVLTFWQKEEKQTKRKTGDRKQVRGHRHSLNQLTLSLLPVNNIHFNITFKPWSFQEAFLRRCIFNSSVLKSMRRAKLIKWSARSCLRVCTFTVAGKLLDLCEKLWTIGVLVWVHWGHVELTEETPLNLHRWSRQGLPFYAIKFV